MSTIIEIDKIGKRYHLGRRRMARSFQEAVFNALKAPFRRIQELSLGGAADEEYWALRDVSLNVERGEVLGLIGRNGAGKSTLLKILSRVVEPTEGQAVLRGRMASLLEVGTGFHPDMTGRENIYLNGSILGMKRAEITRHFDEIVAFAEVENFIDTPVKRYSSGMYVRLAFAVAAHLEPEILIVDEVLAVGDVEFQQKCLGRMKEVSQGHGRTVLFVSHNMAAIEALCRTCVVLEKGGLVRIGTAAECVRDYLKLSKGVNRGGVVRVEAPRGVTPHVTTIRTLVDGEPDDHMPMGADLAFEVDFEAADPLRIVNVRIVIHATGGHALIHASNQFQPSIGYSEPVTHGRVRCSLGAVPFCPGVYPVSVWVGDRAGETHLLEQFFSFEVVERANADMGRVPEAVDSIMWWPARFEFMRRDLLSRTNN
ncbi:MAG: ATP-binding cassette domain-containing protein [Candidatus Hydrogenedentes bacterium]|nr:ATP-binding cassette domain-containing protein [Candidatus Hydrogenedentota bacterium]